MRLFLNSCYYLPLSFVSLQALFFKQTIINYLTRHSEMKKIYCFLPLLILALLTSCETKQSETKPVEAEGNKNAVVEAIMSRRSIRNYKPEQIKDSELKTIIECGINAPSGLNKQNWEVRVIQNPEFIAKMNKGFVDYAAGLKLEGSASKAQEEGFSVFHGAPTVILIASNNTTYSAVDCGLLGQNILLAAESMNIGTCVVGGVKAYLDTPEAKATVIPELKLPEGYEPLYTIVMGYKNESPNAKPRDASKVQYIK